MSFIWTAVLWLLVMPFWPLYGSCSAKPATGWIGAVNSAMQGVAMSKTKRLGFADQMNRLNDEFIELGIRMLRELLRFVDAHKPTRSEQSRNRRNAYTADEDQTIKDGISRGLSSREVAMLVGKSIGSVSTRAYRIGLPFGKKYAHTSTDLCPKEPHNG